MQKLCKLFGACVGFGIGLHFFCLIPAAVAFWHILQAFRPLAGRMAFYCMFLPFGVTGGGTNWSRRIETPKLSFV
ncbi:hypothetical protein DM02DRAFT_111336 [Periconia macrospinosa]|uniref:Uncharacterized protein n=1 Tax=Periconia macrospinosa TaxID=97972 RepID=A0A2V1E3W0_9PLEO|nr:hypothetical protein DM02DRAFT_111336 [Periconia macrospinosa]